MAANPNSIAEKATKFRLNGRVIEAGAEETTLQAAIVGIEIPHLCYQADYRKVGNCRSCMVEIQGERVLAPACCRQPKEGMEISSDNARALLSQKMVLELLLADMPKQGKSPYTLNSELDYWAQKLAVSRPRFESREQLPPDLTHPAIAVNLDACIQCTRCARACREAQVNDVIGYAFRGSHSTVVFDQGDPMGESTCVACGECVQACPTGALMPAREVGLVKPDKAVVSVCPYCGVGYQLTYKIKDNRILYVEGREGPANHRRLCVKGRYGFDYAHHPHRLNKPLIRRQDAPPKSAEFDMDPANPYLVFREVGWEEAYLFQKLVRTGLGSNNVDHCTRLCHVSSVAALLECIGSGAVSNPVADVAKAEVVILIGANPTVNHPVAATWMKNAIKRGTQFIIIDPRRSEMARYATYFLQFKSGTDIALLNALMHTIVEEGLVNAKFIAERTENFAEMKRHLKVYSPEAMAPVCGIPAPTLRACFKTRHSVQAYVTSVLS